MKGGGYGLVGDIIGVFIGGFLVSLLGLSGSTGLIGSICRRLDVHRYGAPSPSSTVRRDKNRP